MTVRRSRSRQWRYAAVSREADLPGDSHFCCPLVGVRCSVVGGMCRSAGGMGLTGVLVVWHPRVGQQLLGLNHTVIAPLGA